MPSLIKKFKENRLIKSSNIYDDGRLLNKVLENYRRIINQLPTVNGEGESITLNGCINAEFVKFKLGANTYQNGEPSPSNEVPIQNVSGENSIIVANSDNTTIDTYPINLPEGMELCKIGNYQDEIINQNGKWYKQAKVIKLTPSTWSKIGTTNYYFMSGVNTTNVKVGLGNIKPNILCNMYQTVTPNNVYHINGDIQQGVSLISSGIIVRDVNVTTVDDFKELTNNLVVYAIYNTPVLTEITNTTLISQLEAISRALSHAGITNITQINDGLPFILEVSALKDLHIFEYENYLNE